MQSFVIISSQWVKKKLLSVSTMYPTTAAKSTDLQGYLQVFCSVRVSEDSF